MARLRVLSALVSRPGVNKALSLGGPTFRHPRQRRAFFTLGIETSCDDTCVSMLYTAENGDFKATWDKRVTCANKHHRGVHPVEAVESHTRNLPALMQAVQDNWKASGVPGPDLIAVTRGPGMKPCLSVGISFAKALSCAWGVPLVGVHHMQAHALSIQLDAEMRRKAGEPKVVLPKYPFLNLLVSGGHTMLVYTKSATEHRVLASTQRGIANRRQGGSATAVGEMLDKCAREIVPEKAISPNMYSVVYAKLMSQYCATDPAYRGLMEGAYEAPQKRQDEIEIYESQNGLWTLPPPLRQSRDMTYEFTGLGGKVRKIISERPDMERKERRELAYQTMRLAFEHIMSRVIMALQNDEELLKSPPQLLAISGGVASSQFLRTVAASMLKARGFGHITVDAPSLKLCTDNATMIAWAGHKMYRAGWTTDLSFLPLDEWPIEEIITGVGCWVRDGVIIPPASRSNVTSSQQDEAELPENSESQDASLPSTPNAPSKPVEVGAPHAIAAHRREAQVESVTQSEDEISETRTNGTKSDGDKASVRRVPGRLLSHDKRHASDSEGPDSPQEGTAQAPPKEPTDRPAQQPRRAPWARKGGSKAAAPPAGGRSATDSLHNPITLLKAAEAQLLAHTAPGAPLRGLMSGLSKPVSPAESLAGVQAGMVWSIGRDSPPGAVQKRARRAQLIAKTRGDVSESLDKARVSSMDLDRAAKPRLEPFGKPPTKPLVRPGKVRMTGTDTGERVPQREMEKKEQESKVENEDQKTENRVVRLLPPAPADQPAPRGSLGTGLDKLKRWIGL